MCPSIASCLKIFTLVKVETFIKRKELLLYSDTSAKTTNEAHIEDKNTVITYSVAAQNQSNIIQMSKKYIKAYILNILEQVSVA